MRHFHEYQPPLGPIPFSRPVEWPHPPTAKQSDEPVPPNIVYPNDTRPYEDTGLVPPPGAGQAEYTYPALPTPEQPAPSEAIPVTEQEIAAAVEYIRAGDQIIDTDDGFTDARTDPDVLDEEHDVPREQYRLLDVTRGGLPGIAKVERDNETEAIKVQVDVPETSTKYTYHVDETGALVETVVQDNAPPESTIVTDPDKARGIATMLKEGTPVQIYGEDLVNDSAESNIFAREQRWDGDPTEYQIEEQAQQATTKLRDIVQSIDEADPNRLDELKTPGTVDSMGGEELYTKDGILITDSSRLSAISTKEPTYSIRCQVNVAPVATINFTEYPPSPTLDETIKESLQALVEDRTPTPRVVEITHRISFRPDSAGRLVRIHKQIVRTNNGTLPPDEPTRRFATPEDVSAFRNLFHSPLPNRPRRS